MASAILQHKLCEKDRSNLHLLDVIEQDKLLRSLRTKAKKDKSEKLILQLNELQKARTFSFLLLQKYLFCG